MSEFNFGGHVSITDMPVAHATPQQMVTQDFIGGPAADIGVAAPHTINNGTRQLEGVGAP